MNIISQHSDHYNRDIPRLRIFPQQAANTVAIKLRQHKVKYYEDGLRSPNGIKAAETIIRHTSTVMGPLEGIIEQRSDFWFILDNLNEFKGHGRLKNTCSMFRIGPCTVKKQLKEIRVFSLQNPSEESGAIIVERLSDGQL